MLQPKLERISSYLKTANITKNQQKYYKIMLQLHDQYEAENRQPQYKNYVQ